VRVRHIDPIDRHQDKAERIAKALIRFRRTCVDSCCREWGGLTKQIKAQIAQKRRHVISFLREELVRRV
jgi:hypothetical protein